ncbi:hypothetical protein K1T71_014351 [Dendrolimus kikuchii]|uniref:Uncharacterized protein n=1 Tax=Dendrolimus kikuchii TaxID=765133 RepID=A0ACC1CDK2_9NEOP|nr:hypothetical protein K1T71_014351 [Dendrolimus kikuchii]
MYDNIQVPYYVKENFHTDYQGSMRRLEMAIEEEYIVTLRHACQREKNYRESMAWKARNFGDSRQYAEAQKLRTPSCERLKNFNR